MAEKNLLSAASKLQEGMTALDAVKELRSQSWGIYVSHHGAGNPFSFTVDRAFLNDLLENGAQKESLSMAKGWKVELPKKDIGPFWSIVQTFRFWLDCHFAPRTSLLREDDFADFLQKYEECKQRWDEAVVELESNYDNLRDLFFQTGYDLALAAYPEEKYPGVAANIQEEMQRCTPSKEEYMKNLDFVVDVRENESNVMFLSAEQKGTLKQIQENAAKRQVEDAVTGCLQYILDSIGGVYKTFLRRREQNPCCVWLEARSKKALSDYRIRAKQNNVFDYEDVNSIIEKMIKLESFVAADDEASAIDSMETILAETYKVAVDYGLTLNLSGSPLSKEELEEVASYL